MSEKRGQSAAGAAVLIAVIAALIIMFVILVPPKERAIILGDEQAPGVPGIPAAEKNLLTASPGRIDYLTQKEVEHPLPAVAVYTRTESKKLADKNLAYAKNGLFSEEVSEFRFMLADVAHTDNVVLHFAVEALSGRLQALFNGEEVYDAEVLLGAIQPIPLPKRLLKDDNLIVFSVSSPGAAFWRTNEVSLKNIRVVGDVTDLGAQFSRNVFLVSETEKQNLEKVTLKFQPGCVSGSSKLQVLVNGHEVYNAVPDCALAFIPLEIAPDSIRRGENEVIFTTERGTYLLSGVVILSELREVEYPTYYFDLSLEEYEQVKDEDLRVRLRMEFVDITTDKFGELIYNGHTQHFDTKEGFFVTDLSEDVVRGANALKIKPRKTIEVRELRVDLVE